jgi:very-short-patch-repair endonuclease
MVAAGAKQLRTNMTDAERKLWRGLLARNIGQKFRRQVPLGPCAVDFVCLESKIVIEVDGGGHATSMKDGARDQYLVERGYHVLRIWNNDVLTKLEGVLTASTEIHPSPGARAFASLRRGAPPSPSRGEGDGASGEGAP